MKDMDRGANQREIVNGAQLPRFSGKRVSICGLVVDVVAGGNSFTLRSADNMVIPIHLRSPLDQPLEGYVEVHGTSQGKSVLAEDFIIFSNKEFDVRGHNALCNLLYTVPNLWRMRSN